MDDKSHVAMEQRVCGVCRQVYDTGNILLHRQLKPVLDRHTLTGVGLCKEHEALYEEGFIALVVVSNEEAKELSFRDAQPTGEIAHLRFSAWDKVFKTPIPKDEDGLPLSFVFCGAKTMEELKRMSGHSDENV